MQSSAADMTERFLDLFFSYYCRYSILVFLNSYYFITSLSLA